VVINTLKLEEIYKPISDDLSLVRQELREVEKSLSSDLTKEVFEHFFKNPGKLLRPSLVLLSAGTCSQAEMNKQKSKLIKLAVAIEMIHGASLVHDDIIDGDEERRGQKTLNKVFGSKTAVLAGDVLYSRAFSILSGTFPEEFSQLILKVTKRMSIVEIGQLISPNLPGMREQYLELINGKTALLMGACCTLGAKLTGVSEQSVALMGNYGMKFGMTYQIVDDFMDNDPLGTGNVKLEEAEKYAGEAKHSISGFKNSECKKSLMDLLEYVLSFSHSNS